MGKTQWNPAQLLETSGNFWLSGTLHAAVKVDVFSTLGGKAYTGAGLAKKMRCETRALTMLMNALTAIGLLRKIGNKYSNTFESETFLAKYSPQYLGYIISHHSHFVESWGNLGKALKTGKPVRTQANFGDRKFLESFLMGMFNMGMSLAPKVAEKVNLSGRNNLLDLGGGPGTYAIYFCLKNPNLNATVFDRPTTRPFAQKTIRKFDLGKRVKFQPGDFTKDEIAGTFDAAWLSHIIHGENPASAQKVIKKAVRALKPGGKIMIHEFILDNTLDGPLFPALFSMNMLLATTGGQAYSESQLTDMLIKAGTKKIRRLDFRGPNDSGIIVAIK